ncbi:MAG: hypothetical protein JXB29_11730 [Sedimentisphaerales bacterium]|nr:hypothetical protein [Sedimentisphaerales bacterium]
MAKSKGPSRRQLAVIEDLFSGQLDEQAVLDKHKVGRNLYNKWLADEGFAECFDRRIAASYRQSEALIARYAPLAAAKLVELTASANQETARKACLDIISLPKLAAKQAKVDKPIEEENVAAEQLSPETASRLLAVLADESA